MRILQASLGIGLFGFILTTTSLQAAPFAPYCSAAAYYPPTEWWTWTVSSIEDSCQVAYQTVAGHTGHVDRSTSGYYDLNGFNRGIVSCPQGQTEVSGFGAQVFTSGLGLTQSWGWSGCVIQLEGL